MGKASFRMLELSELSEESFRILKMDDMKFRMLNLGGLGKVSFEMQVLVELG